MAVRHWHGVLVEVENPLLLPDNLDLVERKIAVSIEGDIPAEVFMKICTDIRRRVIECEDQYPGTLASQAWEEVYRWRVLQLPGNPDSSE